MEISGLQSHVESYPPFAVVPTVPPSTAWKAHPLTISSRQDVPYVCKGGYDSSFLPTPSSCHHFPSFPSLLPQILLLPPVILALSQKSHICSPLRVSALPGSSLYLESSPLGLHLASGPYWKLTLGMSLLATLSVVSLPTVASSSPVFSCLVYVWITYSLHVLG